MKPFHRIGQFFDINPVLRELKSQPLLWGKSPRVTFKGSPHHAVQDIILRGPIGREMNDLHQLYVELQCEDYPMSSMMPKTMSIAYNLAYLLSNDDERDTGGLRLGRVILTKLPAGATIDPHKDEGPVPQFYRRIHLCVAGGDENIFMIDGTVQVMQTSEMFDCDVRRLHTVINLMETDRIHLIVDVER